LFLHIVNTYLIKKFSSKDVTFGIRAKVLRLLENMGSELTMFPL